jgi:hypothetical protein
MRADMAKVIVERPRYGSWMRARHRKGYKRKLQRTPLDEAPRTEGIKEAYGLSGKSLNEHLAPLRRYLLSKVGRPWDKVFSEICARINRNSAVQDHVRDHVWDYVERHVILIDGVPCYGQGYAYGTPLISYRGWSQYYVCPKSGLLKRVKAFRTARRHHAADSKPVPLGACHYCVQLKGAWYMAEVCSFPSYWNAGQVSYLERTCDDVVLGRPIKPPEAKKYYGREVHAVSIRRIGKREMKNLPIPLERRE